MPHNCEPISISSFLNSRDFGRKESRWYSDFSFIDIMLISTADPQVVMSGIVARMLSIFPFITVIGSMADLHK